MSKRSKKQQIYTPKFLSGIKIAFQQRPELHHLMQYFFEEEKDIKLIEKRFEPACKRVMKGRKKYVDEAFTVEEHKKLMFIYVRKDSKQIARDLLEWRGSKMKFDPMFLPVYIDAGINEILWVGVSVSKNSPLQIELAWDSQEKVEKIRQDNPPESPVTLGSD